MNPTPQPHGVLNLLKPPGMTSHDAVAFVRRVLKEKRVGHTGTLDPAAAGVLPICVGQATRLVEDLQAGTKRYLAEATFGRETDSGDLLGETTREADASALTLEAVRAALDTFRGEITQTPPLHSAIKVGGVKLYDLARTGKEIDIPTRQVTVSHLHLTRWESAPPRAYLDIECSGGTYIRSLVRDIGRALGSAATMSFLLRTRSGLFGVEEAVSPKEFEANPQLIPLREVLDWLVVETFTNDELALALWQGKRVAFDAPALSLTQRKEREEEQAMRARRPVSVARMGAANGPILVENAAGTLFALASRETGGLWKADKVFDLRA